MHAPPLGRISQHLSSRPHAVLSHVVMRGAPAPDAAVLFRTAYRRWMASLGTADELSRWSLAPLISPARWQLTLCSDQTRLSHSSAIPKQQMGRAFSSIGFKQVCRALVENLDIMCVLSVAAPPGRTTTVSTDVNERSVADESV